MSFSTLYARTLLFFTIFVSSRAILDGNITDHQALLEIKAKISDPLGALSSWNDTLPLCQWHGVTCGHAHHRVTSLDLESSKLGGSISPYIGNLSFLRFLIIHNNSLTGQIPPQIGNLHRLQVLDLSNNSFVGEIPSNISGCSRLVSFRAKYNKLEGRIPRELGSLLNLEYLSFLGNNLTGTIPPSLGNLTYLSNLSLTMNQLDGSVPHSIGQLKFMNLLLLGGNWLSGTIPPSIFNLSLLVSLDLGMNGFEGTLPSDLGIALPKLHFFSIFANFFTGPIPTTISNASNLERVQLNVNHLVGQVPSLENLRQLNWFTVSGNFLGHGLVSDLRFLASLKNASQLQMLHIDHNKFGGKLDGETISNLPISLTDFLANNNNIQGQIPVAVVNLSNLQVFGVSHNQLTGDIPVSIGQLRYLGSLLLDANQLSGYIPSSLGNLTMLTLLDLSKNELEGKIPSSLQNCRSLIAFDFSQNRLTGNIPAKVLGLPSLSVGIGLARNRLSGPLPVEIGQLNNLIQLDISENMISGEIPSSLSGCLSLQVLQMQRNNFQGQIPLSLSSLKGLYSMDLSYNNLSGEIPDFLASFPLQMLNLSYNNLEGKVPIGGVFNNLTAISIQGNPELCGGMPKLKLPICKMNHKTPNKRLNHKWRLVIAILSSFSGVVLLFFILAYVFWFQKKRNEPPLGVHLENGLENLSYQSLLKATNGFSEENLLGVSSYGSVYRGILDQNGTIVAIKVFNLHHQGASKSFKAECKALRNIRHRNLVKVLTVCSSIDHQGNDFKALVYEFMANGSLEDWLYSTQINIYDNSITDPPKHLNFLQRLDIAIDVASALEYLHHHCGSSIIHCDLKPSNILLDDEMIAHVGDFGLAKFLSQVHSSSHSNQSSSIAMKGTIGYAPPESGMGNEVTTYGDIYSFGVLLLEMFTRKKPTDEMFKGGLNLHNFVKAAFPDQLLEILDPVLLQHMDNVEYCDRRSPNAISNNTLIEGLISVFRIGLCCSAEMPRERMGIIEATAELVSTRNKLLMTHRGRATVS